MTRVFCFAALACSVLFTSPGVGAESIKLALNPDRVVNGIDEKVYGHFLEHIYNSCNGGLWGELIWNRSFEHNAAGL